MSRPLLKSLLLIVAMISPALAASPPASQPQCEWTGIDRIVAIGDVHGDCGQFVKALRLGGLIDEKLDWAGGKTHLVQTGDVFDRGAESRKAMDLLMKLEPQAVKAGGAVHPLIGNHEAMVLLSDLRYMADDEKESYGGDEGLKKLMAVDGKYGRWIRSHNAVIRINDVLFCHAGLSGGVAARYKTLAEINREIRSELLKGDEDGLAMSPTGPLWIRSLAESVNGRDDNEPLILPALKKFGAARMVVGHTIIENCITVGLNDRLILIDVGMTGYYGGPAACLVIEKGEFFNVQNGEKRQKLFSAPIAPATSQPETLKPAA